LADDWAVDEFADQVEGQRVAVLCPLAPKPILLDVIQVDEATRMMKVKTVMPDATEGREWWLSLGAVITVAIVPKEPNLVQPVPSGVVLF
jgi:hypothetical protein